MAADAMSRGRSLNEYELQQQMMRWFDEEGLVTDSPPVVAVGGNAGDPHYLPTADQCRAVVPNEVLLLDLWGKKQSKGAVFADITWVAVTSARVPDEVSRAFRAVADARDAAVRLVVEAARDGRDLRGWEVDEAARAGTEGSGIRRSNRAPHRP